MVNKKLKFIVDSVDIMCVDYDDCMSRKKPRPCQIIKGILGVVSKAKSTCEVVCKNPSQRVMVWNNSD